jgi:hypothetical protein
MRGKLNDRSVEARLRREAPERPALSRGFGERLRARLDLVSPDAGESPPLRAPALPAPGAILLAAAAVLVLAMVVVTARRPDGRHETPGEPAAAMGEALRLSAVERPRGLVTAMGRESGRLSAERERLLADARRINSTLLAPLRSVLAPGG